MKNEMNFEVSYLYTAYNILEDSGQAAFREYINRVDMPSIDIARVISKFNYEHDIGGFRAKINHIKNEFKRKMEGIG